MNRVITALLTATFVFGVASVAHAGDGMASYGGDSVTAHLSHRLGALTRSPYGYGTPELDHLARGYHAENVWLDDVNRWATIMHTQKPYAKRFARSIKGTAWYVVKRNRFVIPMRRGPFLVDDCATGPCVRSSLGDAARWIARKLGPGWRVVSPSA